MKMQQYDKLQINNRFFRCLIMFFLFNITTQALAVGNRKAVINYSPPPFFIAVDLNRDGKVNKKDIEQIKPVDILAGKMPNDATTPTLPYRFWLNDDLDVINAYGSIKYELTSCVTIETYSSGENQQQCEQWDEDPDQQAGKRTNTSPANMLNKIESYRDLEDFAPLLIYIKKGPDRDDYIIKLKAVGVNINLFKSNWSDVGAHVAHEYIFDINKTKEQVELANAPGNASNSKGHFATVYDGEDGIEITPELIEDYFDTATGEGKFIFEAVAASPSTCASNAENCYLALELTKKDDETFEKVSRKVYMDIHNIKDYYQHITAGSAQGGSGYQTTVDEFSGETIISYNAFHAKYIGGSSAVHDRVLDIYQGLFPQSQITQDLVVQVHGWRMRDAEKVNFAETSFKRLYWSGYKSQFTTFSWPTGWFEKPAHIYSSFGLLGYVLGNERNYDVSELVARKVGEDFRNWLTDTPRPSTHVIAHSMGNVVVSEALKYTGTGNIITSYTASQAATGAGSYNSNTADLQHELQVPSWLACPFSGGSSRTTEEAWRCYNIDNQLQVDDTVYDMPPDMYRDNLVVDDGQGNMVVKHGPTSETVMGRNSTGNHYYKGISTHVQRILNFYNPEDAALTAWEFNQLTKPDYAQGLSWSYTNSYHKAYTVYETCLFFNSEETDPEAYCADQKPADNIQVVSEFKEGDIDIPYSLENAYKILAHAIPARTEPLGQAHTLGEIETNGNLGMIGFTNSNQDHSAPFHGYYSQSRNDTSFRANYWNSVISKSLRLIGLNDLTGLKK